MRKQYGIKKRYIAYTLWLLVITLFLSSLGVGLYMRNKTRKTLTQNYLSLSKQISQSVGEKFHASDAETEKCILYSEVQKSLTAELTAEETNALRKYFETVDLPQVEDYFYIDNKRHIYTKPYAFASYEDFCKSSLTEALGSAYADTKWVLQRDMLFGSGEMALFIGRKIRSLDYAVPPGYLFLKMHDAYLDTIFDQYEGEKQRAIFGLADSRGTIFSLSVPPGITFSEDEKAAVKKVAASGKKGVIARGIPVQGGLLCAVRQAETGFAVFAFIPERVVTKEAVDVLAILFVLYAVVFGIAVMLSCYQAKKFTEPVRVISAAMASFDGSDFSGVPFLETRTELDDMGGAYNDLLGRLKTLIEEVREKERALKKSEMSVLMNQINPHFLYNTLDTIYMLERLGRGDAAAKMIEALSSYLRLSLSKGRDYISLREELDNVQCYLEIMKMRDPELFSYEIVSTADKDARTLKLVLQPLAENAVKYGFAEIYAGGHIRISAESRAGMLIYEVENTGQPMAEDLRDEINRRVQKCPLTIRDLFGDRQKGCGLANLITRLHMAYGDNLIFRYETGDNFTRCHIEIGEEKADDEKTGHRDCDVSPADD